MDCYKGWSFLQGGLTRFTRIFCAIYVYICQRKSTVKAQKSLYNRYFCQCFLGVFLSVFLIPCSVAAQEGIFSSANIIPFSVGLSLPILVFLFWKLVSKPTNKTTLTSSEQSHPAQASYPVDLATNLPMAQHALKQFKQALKTKKYTKLAAIVFKPINFQQVNTILGRHNSDILLMQLALCLKKSVADNPNLLDFDNNEKSIKLARLHGLDFLVVFDLTQTKFDAKSVIDELCHQLTKAVPNAMSFKSFSLNFELAFGVAISKEHGSSVDELVSHATDALLKGINSEQKIQYFDNNSIFYTEQQLRLMERLRQDILDEKLQWSLQPQVNINTNAIVGFELKVNWLREGEKSLALSDFIDLAEYSGDVYLLTKQMIKQAFKALFSLHKNSVYQQVSVNLSSQSLLEPDLVDYIELQMKNYNIAGKYLMIELDEKVMLSACQRAKNTIDQLKSLDITVSIDNFSGSYESLRYLRKMAIHQVKINCQELNDNDENRAENAIINALITLTQSMSLPFVTTNIDSTETATKITSMGGSLVQGNIIHNGVNINDIDSWINKWFSLHPQN